jgi:FtsZ-interacting cell division protein ZipA
MDLGGGNWAILNIVGPLLLAAVLLWALLRNRKSRKVDVDRTEQATRDLYRQEEEKRRTGDDRTS